MSSLYSKKLYGLVAVLVLSLALAACGSDKNDGKDGDSKSNDAPKTEVSMQLGWVHTFEYAGFYMAENRGLYADNDLSVNLVEGGFDAEGTFISPVDQVLNGTADFGLASSDTLLLARANGQPVVAIATIYQRNPVALASMTDKGIQRPADLEGKTLVGSASTSLGITAFLNSQELTDKVDYTLRTDPSNAPLTNGDADVIDVFITNQPIELQSEGYDINLILLSDYGIDIYPNVIFTTEAMLTEQPDVVQRFLDATLAGYQLAVNNPQDAAKSVEKYDEAFNLDFASEGMQVSIPLIAPASSQPGMMTASSWEYTHSIMVNQGLLDGDGAIDVSQAYTMDVLNAIYNK